MKSINFTLLKDKLLTGEKTQTIRCIYIPFYKENEKVLLKFKGDPILEAKITDYYPKKLKEITEEEAVRDGFESKEECIKGLKEINGIKSEEHYCFIIRFEIIGKITKLTDF